MRITEASLKHSGVIGRCYLAAERGRGEQKQQKTGDLKKHCQLARLELF